MLSCRYLFLRWLQFFSKGNRMEDFTNLPVILVFSYQQWKNGFIFLQFLFFFYEPDFALFFDPRFQQITGLFTTEFFLTLELRENFSLD